jgi:hypothetical protein
MFRNSGLPWELFQVKALMAIHCNQGNPSQIIPFLPVDDSQGKLLTDIERRLSGKFSRLSLHDTSTALR